MSERDKSKLPRIVKIIVDVIFGLLVGVCVFLTLWIVLSPLIMRSNTIPITASVPVTIGIGPEPRIEVQVSNVEQKGINNAFIDEAQGTLRLETTNWVFVLISNLAKLLTAIALVYVFYLLRSVLKVIDEGRPFIAENSKTIRRIGYMVMLVGFLRPAVEYIAAQEILSRLKITAPMLSPPSGFQAEVILASLLILLLAQVWSYGIELKRDQALTI